MANTYTLISSVTVSAGGAASVSFSSIPQTYTDLIIKFSSRDDYSAIVRGLYWYFNGDTTTGNYSNRRIYGNGASAASDTSIAPIFEPSGNSTSNTFANGEVYIPNYTGSNYKSFSADYVAENNATTSYVGLNAGVRNNTAAITSITITPENGNYVQYSNFYLYGIKNS